MLARYTDDFVAARVAHESAERPAALASAGPTEIVRAIERMDGVEAASGSLVGLGACSRSASKQYPVDLRGIDPMRQDRVTPISRVHASTAATARSERRPTASSSAPASPAQLGR